MNKNLRLAVVALVAVCLLVGVWSAIPASATIKSAIRHTVSQSPIGLSGTFCSKCGCPLNGLDGEQSQLAQSLGLTLCMDCWLDAFYGSDRSDSLPTIVTLSGDGKVPTVQLGGNGADYTKYLRGDQTWAIPTAQAAWGSITGNITAQTDLQGALDSKETPAGAQAKVGTHNSTYVHTDIALNTEARHAHSNMTILNAIQESFTTALKASYDWLVSNVTEAWKASVDAHTDNTSNPHNVTDAQVLPSQTGQGGKFLSTNGTSTLWDTAGGGTFLSLTDTPGNYAGSTDKVLVGNATEDGLVFADPIPKATDWNGSFNWDTSEYTTTEIDISGLFSANLTGTVRRSYAVYLDLTNVEADASFVSLYLAVKTKVDGTNYRAIDRKTILKADIGANAEPNIVIVIPSIAQDAQITMQMSVALAGDATIYYAVVKEHLE